MDQRFIDVLTPYLRFHNGEPIRPESDLRTLGLDSMQAIEVLFAIEDDVHAGQPGALRLPHHPPRVRDRDDQLRGVWLPGAQPD